MSQVVIGAASSNQIVIGESNTSITIASPMSALTTIVAQGPQGPPGSDGIIVNEAAKVDKSLVYYDAAASSFKADDIWTVSTLSDGGNF